MTETHKAAVEALERIIGEGELGEDDTHHDNDTAKIFFFDNYYRTILKALRTLKQPSSVEVTERFFIDTDNSGNKFLIPFDKKSEWEEYLTIPEDDERSWDVPDFAYPLEGEIVVFSDPRIKGFPVGRITRAAATDGVE